MGVPHGAIVQREDTRLAVWECQFDPGWIHRLNADRQVRKEATVAFDHQGAVVQREDATFATSRCRFDPGWLHSVLGGTIDL